MTTDMRPSLRAENSQTFLEDNFWKSQILNKPLALTEIINFFLCKIWSGSQEVSRFQSHLDLIIPFLNCPDGIIVQVTFHFDNMLFHMH